MIYYMHTGSIVHDMVEYVHDWSAYLAECLYDSVEGIKTAREFVIKLRPTDSGVYLCVLSMPPNNVHRTDAMCWSVHVFQLQFSGTSQTLRIDICTRL